MLNEMISVISKLFNKKPTINHKNILESETDIKQLIKELARLDVLMCTSADIASTKYSTNACHMLKILENQHIGLEKLLKNLNVSIHRSEIGSEFNPELQETDSSYVETDNLVLDGKIAKVISPAIWHSGKLINCEHVRLYLYKANK